LLKNQFQADECFWIDLLSPEQQERYSRNPDTLTAEVRARKLKKNAANLLAGRAFVSYLAPFTFEELGNDFNLMSALSFGMLPKIYNFSTDRQKNQYLKSYALTYLKEEVWHEQIIRNLDPFRYFLEVSAQCNGKVLNYSKIARDVGVDHKTVENYYSILEDTLLGFFVTGYHDSFRKQLGQAPKFIFLISVLLVPCLGCYRSQSENAHLTSGNYSSNLSWLKFINTFNIITMIIS
jgi:predicted AAA+ superfamily ATPase